MTPSLHTPSTPSAAAATHPWPPSPPVWLCHVGAVNRYHTSPGGKVSPPASATGSPTATRPPLLPLFVFGSLSSPASPPGSGRPPPPRRCVRPNGALRGFMCQLPSVSLPSRPCSSTVEGVTHLLARQINSGRISADG